MAVPARFWRHPAALVGLFGLAVAIGVACRGPGGSGLTLTLLPDASCTGVPVGCTSHLDVSLQAEAGPIDTTVPFTINGGAAPLGDLPTHGTGSFAVAGVSTADATVFAGTSGTITFTDHDQAIDVSVHCLTPPPCDATPKHFADDQPADLVLGQPGYLTCDPAAVAATARLDEPRAVAVASDELWVADTADHRIAVYRGLATISTGASLAINVGHAALGGVGAGTTATALTHPHGFAVLSDRLVVLDTDDNRGQIFVPLPTTNGPTASFSLGQASPSGAVTANAGGLSAKSLSAANSAVVLGTNLFVSDSGNSRVLRFAASELNSDAPKANLVLGAPSFTVATNGTFSAAIGQLATDGARLYVADVGFNRVLVWNSAAKLAANDAPPSFVIGQPDFATKTANTGGLSPHSLNQPRGVAASPSRLVIADSSNHRVLVWEPPPSAGDVDASFVLGQSDFVSNAPNPGGAAVPCPTMQDCTPASPREPTQRSVSRPGAAWLDGDAMWVSDSCNARVLRFTAH